MSKKHMIFSFVAGAITSYAISYITQPDFTATDTTLRHSSGIEIPIEYRVNQTYNRPEIVAGTVYQRVQSLSDESKDSVKRESERLLNEYVSQMQIND